VHLHKQSQTRPTILVAGIGNIFLGDDAFGVEVAQRLAQRQLPENVRVIDFGIRGIDLTYALLDGYDMVILVDTSQRGGEPGTLYVLDPNLAVGSKPDFEAHGLVPSKALELAGVLGGPCGKIRLVCCEPATLDTADEGQTGLSAPVQNAVAEALNLIESLIDEFTLRFHG
jgi:hydrogenase maturation protease